MKKTYGVFNFIRVVKMFVFNLVFNRISPEKYLH